MTDEELREVYVGMIYDISQEWYRMLITSKEASKKIKEIAESL